tara:strand:+ start:5114 stop:5815 length:702 start_codon:yes stop_codon:yes gene_type:complete
MLYNFLKNLIPLESRKTWNRKKRALLRGKKQKIFCVGFNKTGTTSLGRAMSDLGYSVGDQKIAENLHAGYLQRNFRKIIRHSMTADFFQDIPYSCPFTFVALDLNFKDAKFILTVRDSSEQWYNSITKFHTLKWGKNGNLPTKEDLKEADYVFKGYPWIMNRIMFQSPEESPYNRKVLIAAYERHIENVKEYFKDRPESLLILNVAEDGAYQKLARFLNTKTDKVDFPWLKKT